MTRHSQRGATLGVTLILLVVATLLVVEGLRLSSSGVEVTTNAQRRMEAEAAAQRTVETAVGSALLTSSPTNVFVVPCGTANTLCYDANGDGSNDVTAVLTPTPTCVRVAPIPQRTLDVARVNDQVCIAQQGQSFGVAGALPGVSLCANTVWEVRAVATDASTGASAAVTQGVATRVRQQDVASSCP